eukprot:13528793-Alexandrium_andersonii.AAC.1
MEAFGFTGAAQPSMAVDVAVGASARDILGMVDAWALATQTSAGAFDFVLGLMTQHASVHPRCVSLVQLCQQVAGSSAWSVRWFHWDTVSGDPSVGPYDVGCFAG